MHSFTELVDRCAALTISSLKEINDRTIESLQTSGATSLVKTLQMIQLQKSILVVGMFSLFESSLQDGLKCKNGFDGALRILEKERELTLVDSFNILYLAVNVLKHGTGKSYKALVARAEYSLPFQIRMPGENFFDEGDVSEIFNLIRVDDEFVQYCADVIRQVFDIVKNNFYRFQ